MINYKKILVTGASLKFEPGVILGLDTKMQLRFYDRIERINGESAMAKREWKATTAIVLRRGDVVWVDEKSLPKNGEGLFEVVDMSKTYQEMSAPVLPKPAPIEAKVQTREREHGINR